MAKINVSLSMAYPLAECKRKIKYKVEQIAAHVGLVCLYPEDEAVNHWLSELAGHLRYVRRYTETKNGTMSFETLNDLLYTQPLESDRQKQILKADCVSHMFGKPAGGNLSMLTLLYHGFTSICLGSSSIDMLSVRAVFADLEVLSE